MTPLPPSSIRIVASQDPASGSGALPTPAEDGAGLDADGPAQSPPARPLGAPRYDLDVVVAGLRASRDVTHNIRRGGRIRRAPSIGVLNGVVDELTAALFPSHHGPGDLRPSDFDAFVRGTLNGALSVLEQEILHGLDFKHDDRGSDAAREAEALSITQAFSATLSAVRSALVADLGAFGGAASAAAGLPERLLADVGVGAIIGFRLAHVLDGLGASLVARLVSAVARRRTGVDIHPGATIGSGFCIVGGQGIVIGEGTVLGSGVRLHGAVTLGSADAAARSSAGAPVIEDDVTIYPGATILGPVTVGRGSVIGGGVWLTGDVPPHSRIVQAAPRTVPPA